MPTLCTYLFDERQEKNTLPKWAPTNNNNTKYKPKKERITLRSYFTQNEPKRDLR